MESVPIESVDDQNEKSLGNQPEKAYYAQAKIEDILNIDTAFHHLSGIHQESRKGPQELHTLWAKDVREYCEQKDFRNRLSKIFELGILGQSMKFGVIDSKESYKKELSDVEDQYQSPNVYFNIYNRSADRNGEGNKRLSTKYFNHGLTVLFDVPSKESFGETYNPHNFDIKIGEYSIAPHSSLGQTIQRIQREIHPDIKPNDPRLLELLEKSIERGGVLSEHMTLEGETRGMTRVGPMDGFRTRLRIAPRKFKGIVIDCDKLKNVIFKEDLVQDDESVTDEELCKRFREFSHKLANGDITNQERESAIIDVIQDALKNIKPEYMVPIYDPDGNLLWPQRVSHDEIIKLESLKKMD